ncbi:hypothetical protein Ddye_022364 [Dipteronia dyeriana]|uniref:RING-type domain-containing protein n=1 Tax=Dipteronia dyeriana TaxID=168575 RepID=A0AAD9U3H3_9ROSI|nr:hypothetical protein Ddye_022364 [Dipteronia dyeriana]
MMTTPTSQVRKLNREELEACMTCLLCQKLFTDATTISECLHTFCRKCIYDNIVEDDLHSCPICNSDLGVAPLEKLRADNNLQDLRSKIFPSTQHNTSATEAVPSVQQRPTIKERSQTPNVIALPRLIGKRSKPVKDMEAHQVSLSSPRTFSELAQNKRRIPFTAKTSEQQTPDKDTEVEIIQYGKAGLWKPLNSPVLVGSKTKSNKSNSQGTVAKLAVPDARDNETLPKSRAEEGGNASKVHGNENDAILTPSGSVKPKRYQTRQRKAVVSEGLSVPAQAIVDTNSNRDERSSPITDVWKLLDSPVDAASKIKSNKSNSQGIVAKPTVPDFRDNETRHKARVEEGGNASKVCGKENDAVPVPSGSMKPGRYQTRHRKTAASEGLSVPAQAVVDTNSKRDERSSPIWFSLIASKNQPGDAPLPQIPSSYLRIKDSSLPVSFIKKYIVKKLNLISETEVEISLWGEPLLPTMPLHTIASWYAQTTPSKERIQTTVGSSARDLVMILRYSRKAPPPLQTCFKNAYSHYFQ